MTLSAPSRRRFLFGLGACAFVPSVVAVTSSPVAAASEEEVPECLADLIESGEVTRADLLAG